MSPIADMLTRIRNAQAVGKERVFVPFSKVKQQIARILNENGYVGTIERRKRKTIKSEHEWLDVSLKYDGGLGAISGLRMISLPFRRLYTSARNIKPVRSGFGIAVISTPRGIMSSKNARKERVGGEIMFEVW